MPDVVSAHGATAPSGSGSDWIRRQPNNTGFGNFVNGDTPRRQSERYQK